MRALLVLCLLMSLSIPVATSAEVSADCDLERAPSTARCKAGPCTAARDVYQLVDLARCELLLRGVESCVVRVPVGWNGLPTRCEGALSFAAEHVVWECWRTSAPLTSPVIACWIYTPDQEPGSDPVVECGRYSAGGPLTTWECRHIPL